MPWNYFYSLTFGPYLVFHRLSGVIRSFSALRCSRLRVAFLYKGTMQPEFHSLAPPTLHTNIRPLGVLESFAFPAN